VFNSGGGFVFMTPSQAIHHTEQMDAARAEFQKLWAELKESMMGLQRMKQADQVTAEIVAWLAFKAGKGIK
jgi:hypothetical protein